jgi:hypothetical protein
LNQKSNLTGLKSKSSQITQLESTQLTQKSKYSDLKLWVFSLNFGAAVLKKHCVAATSVYPSIHLCTLKKCAPKAEMAAY